MDILTALIHSAAIALSLSLAFSGFMIFAGVGDVPDGRSSHIGVTPTSGGLGIAAGLGGAILCVGLFYPYFLGGQTLAKVLSIGLGLCLLGLTDDVYGMNPAFKMLLIAVFSALAVWAVGPVMELPVHYKTIDLPLWAGFGGSVLWVFVVINAVNFVDGANGMMPLSLGIAAAALAGIALLVEAPQTAIVSAALGASLLGFLPYNFKRQALIFSGDVGALFAGFIFAVAILLLVNEAPDFHLVYVGPLLILPFLTDVFLTLLRRVRRGDNLMQAHNQHLYQRLIQGGFGHLSTTNIYAIGTLICAAIAFNGILRHFIHSVFMFGLFVGIAILVYIAAFVWLKRKAS